MSRRSLIVAKLAVFTSLVAVATMVISVYVPATRGYFNLGETMIYFTALTMGPGIAAFAGGVGSMLADLVLGYYYYAPATLLIKAAEGALAGYLVKKAPKKSGWQFALASYALIAGYFVLILLIGIMLFVGEVEVSILPIGEGVQQFIFTIPHYSWVGLAAAAVATPVYFVIREKGHEGWLILSLLLSGLLMVVGYFIYQQFFLGVAALVEIPVNLGQSIIGTAVAIPLYKAFRKLYRVA
ncbi:MAG: ECF transporter S component [Nitrososphaerota archaeon]|nr:ECF transporter S component [Aigarchaeota archaeon]MDW8076311.1 ECF transporter S component [Nitrososphaerota archaeon]